MATKRYLVSWSDRNEAVARVTIDGLTEEEVKERARALVFDEVECDSFERVYEFEGKCQGDTVVSPLWKGLDGLLDMMDCPE